MKKIALITNGQARYLTHEWLHGYRRYISDHNSDIDLYIFHCFGNFSQDQSYNVGEYNIFRLPRLSDFDGILLDLALISDHELKEEIIIRAPFDIDLGPNHTCQKSIYSRHFFSGQSTGSLFFRN